MHFGVMTESIDHIIIYCDGGARGNPGPAGIGAVVSDPDGNVLESVSQYIGEATNNIAEYKALVAGLEAAARFDAARLTVRADSELMVRQLNGEYKVKNEGLKPLYQRVLELINTYDDVSISHVFREDNVEADLLVNAAIDAHLGT